MSTKISDFVQILSVDDSGLLTVVQNNQNFTITQENYLAQFGATGTIVQAGEVTATPVLDTQGTVNNIRNIEDGPGIQSSVSPQNGLTLEHSLLAGTTGVPVFTDITTATPLIRSLFAGDNVSLSVNADSVRIDASVGTVPSTVIVQSAADFPNAVAGVRVLPAATPTVWVIKGVIDLGTDVIQMEGGHSISGDTTAISGITTLSASPTVTAINGGGFPCSIVASTGILINNTGAGAAVRVEGADTIFFGNLVNTQDAGNVLEIHDALFVVVDGWSMTGSTNGIVMTGTANNGPIIGSVTTSGLTGKGVYINGDIPALGTPILILDSVFAFCGGNGVEVASTATYQGIGFTGNLSSTGGNAMKLAGTNAGGTSISGANLLSITQEAFDYTGSTNASMTVRGSGISSVAAGKAAIKGDAGSVNINTGGNAIFETCRINNIGDATADPLSGITKKDLQYAFLNAGPRVTNSTHLGAITLDAQATTTITYQGADGTVASMADSATSPGVDTTITTSGAHGMVNGQMVAIYGTTEYNGIFTISVASGSVFDITRVYTTNEAVGSWEAGWEKIAGSTTLGDTAERFDLPNDNQLRSLDAKTLPVTYTAIITGEKTGTGQLMEFALFHDSNDGDGFIKINGSFQRTITTSAGQLTVRVATESEEDSLFTVYVRNMAGTSNFICDALNADVGVS